MSFTFPVAILNGTRFFFDSTTTSAQCVFEQNSRYTSAIVTYVCVKYQCDCDLQQRYMLSVYDLRGGDLAPLRAGRIYNLNFHIHEG